MKAVIYEKYGSPEVLQLKDIDKPTPKENEILVKIHSTSVTAGDWRMRKADPFLVRLFNGVFRPKKVKILGFELAGTIEEVGSEITKFKKGDNVFAFCGYKFGAYAEYKTLSIDEEVELMPSNLSFEEAAVIPLGALTALKFLHKAGIKVNQNVLIYGASGSVGTYAVQLGKYFNTNITAVCGPTNFDLVKSLGADKIIDYTTQDIYKLNDKFDIIFDAVGKYSKRSSKILLKPNGKYVSVLGSVRNKKGDLLFLRDIIEKGKLVPVIDKKYNLDQIREAHSYVESFHKKGNVVINIT